MKKFVYKSPFLLLFTLAGCFFWSISSSYKQVNNYLPGDELLDTSKFLKAVKEKLCVERVKPWQFIVIHHSATDGGNAEIFDKWHKQKGWNGLGYHFVIGNGNGCGDGEIEVGYRWIEQLEGAHAGSSFFNKYGIGICLVGNFENYLPTAKQSQSFYDLVQYLMKRLALNERCITLHRYIRDIERGETLCPGKNMTIERVRLMATKKI